MARWFARTLPSPRHRALLVALALLASPPEVRATDVDGGNDCAESREDWGDAPEGIPAYPGVLACFPTCSIAGPVGTQTFVCPPRGTAPGPAGFVRHVLPAGQHPFWLGCFAGNGGIDSDPDGKVNASGTPVSDCSGSAVDCTESAFGLTFGQDECYGSNDAGIAAAVSFTACSPSNVTFNVTSCDPDQPRTVYLNVLVDWNRDGDWNDNFQCPGQPDCAHEWAVKNVAFAIGTGCTSLTSPDFLAGPSAGEGWMRITVSDGPVNDDFPWAGVETDPVPELHNGETEDYPVTIANPTGANCPDTYDDRGDAPEGVPAYGGAVIGAFPTCMSGSPAGAQDLACGAISTLPGPLAGSVLHLTRPGDPRFWFGCGDPAAGWSGVDSEPEGKVNTTGPGASDCDGVTPVDVAEPAPFGTFGQDEAIGDPDGDAGLRAPVTFTICSRDSVDLLVMNCDTGEFTFAYLNVLVDMNADGDWNDNFRCGAECAFEWAVKNRPVALPPGCTTLNTGSFLVGPNAGPAWMRTTLTLQPVGDDFPWNGSASAPGGAFACGETEDHPVTIAGPDTCAVSYEDFGDAPEKLDAYLSGVVGAFPTCLGVGPAGTQEVQCGAAPGTPPGPTGHVRHLATPADPAHFWLGCGQYVVPLSAVDSETDGKVNIGAGSGGPSSCDPSVATDCMESLIGLSMNQDECLGDLDAGLTQPKHFAQCSLGVVNVEAYNCDQQDAAAVLNVLVDWNHDGDWNDVLAPACGQTACTPEWVVKNLAVALTPGCNFLQTPAFQTGQYPDRSWMRVTLTPAAVADDFPWNGSASEPGGFYAGGETEDHPVNVTVRTTGVTAGLPGRGVWLGAAAPNPSRDGFTIGWSLPVDADVSLAVHDLAGRRLATLASGRVAAGAHTSRWNWTDTDGRPLAAGHYVVRLRVGDEVQSRSVVRVR
ncbi:MAG: hypothetical protein IT347_06435 [Candidatus Eisenbacteria bacterium]|nr:hypothetical protein [Candidatus Eisenbacteria bacterium]